MNRSPKLYCVLIACSIHSILATSHSTHAQSQDGERAYKRGIEHLKASEFEDAVQAFSDVIVLHPNSDEAYEARAAAYDGLAPRLIDLDERERAALRAVSDRHKAAELRAERQLWKDLPPFNRFRVPPVSVVVYLVYLGFWGVLLYFWRARRYSLIWPLVGFFLCGPLTLIFLGIYLITGAQNSPSPEKPFDDHPLEIALREESKTGANEGDANDTKPCPKCGRINAASTRVCPSCEHRIR